MRLSDGRHSYAASCGVRTRRPPGTPLYNLIHETFETFYTRVRTDCMSGNSDCNLAKKEIFIRDLTIDFNADRNQNEKRFTIGEHNGEEWVRKPKSIILNQARESSSDFLDFRPHELSKERHNDIRKK